MTRSDVLTVIGIIVALIIISLIAASKVDATPEQQPTPTPDVFECGVLSIDGPVACSVGGGS